MSDAADLESLEVCFCFFVFILFDHLKRVRIVDVQILLEEKKPVTNIRPSNFDHYDNGINLFILEQKNTMYYASS